ncbi:MAG: nodulation protein NfeD [Cytophagales bacterium]|nr:nodulation protein NfeD [Cytophagales bacterium]MDW8383212.1 NfeD family protein [Flammeovirgaceae bacterium]
MKNIISYLIRFLWACLLFPGMSIAQEKQAKIFVIEIRDVIDPPMNRYVKLAFEEMEKQNPDLVIIDMNTYGGTVNDADEIRQRILKSKYKIVTFINENAASAGALIAISTDSIYMSPGASIGAATVVNGTDGSKAPDKYQSYMRAKMRATAEAKKRNPDIAQAMVDESIRIPGITDSGQVLTFSTKEAIKHGFCEAELNSIEEVIQRNGFKNFTIYKFQLNIVEKIIAWVLNPVVSSILILIILGGIYYELQTPGVGFPLLAAIVAGLIYLIPYYLNGLAQYWEIISLLGGIILIATEIFVLPGFGIVGIAGIFLTFGSLLLIMLQNDFFDFSTVDSKQLSSAVWVTMGGIVASMLLIVLGSNRIIQSYFFEKIALQTTLRTQEGYTSATYSEELIGKTGETYTVLRPGGKVIINGKIYDAISDGSFIEKGKEIVVVAKEVNSLVVTLKDA